MQFCSLLCFASFCAFGDLKGNFKRTFLNCNFKVIEFRNLPCRQVWSRHGDVVVRSKCLDWRPDPLKIRDGVFEKLFVKMKFVFV